MSAPETGACADWLTWDDLPCDVDLSGLPGDEDDWQALILSSVTNTLYERSCRQFGLCEITARPVPCCRHRRTFCSCGQYNYIGLGVEPIAEVTEVLIDGDILATSAYRVDEFAWLVRIDGNDWPTCNDLSLADTEDGTFSVTWSYGLEVPPEAKLAAGLVACKWARELISICGQTAANAESIAREGVTIILNPGERIGIDLVDNWLAQFHCGGHIFDPGFQRSILKVNT